MKKTCLTLISCLLLSTLFAATALGATTGIAMDSKTYTFTGSEGTYEADGMTFVIGKDSVVVRQAGKADQTLPLTQSTDEDWAVPVQSGEINVGVVSEDAVHFIASGEIGRVVQSPAYAQASCAVESVKEGTYNPERYSAYAKYGLSYDAEQDALYYQGKRVRIFEDSYPLADQAYASLEHVDVLGTVDVKARRDLSQFIYHADGSYDPSGILTGLYALSDAEFASRDLRQWTSPAPQQATAVEEGVSLTPAQQKAFFAPYANFGLHYDVATDTLNYQGKTVRRFLDVRQTNGESFSGGLFKGSMTHIRKDFGEVDIETIRDYDKPDAMGEGALIGMSVNPVK